MENSDGLDYMSNGIEVYKLKMLMILTDRHKDISYGLVTVREEHFPLVDVFFILITCPCDVCVKSWPNGGASIDASFEI